MKRSNVKERKLIALRLDDEDYEFVEHLAYASDVSVGACCRAIMQEYIQQVRTKARGTEGQKRAMPHTPSVSGRANGLGTLFSNVLQKAGQPKRKAAGMF